MSKCSPVDSEFYRMLLREDENIGEMILDPEEYLVPNTRKGDEPQANGLSRHQSYRVSGVGGGWVILSLSILYNYMYLYLSYIDRYMFFLIGPFAGFNHSQTEFTCYVMTVVHVGPYISSFT